MSEEGRAALLVRQVCAGARYREIAPELVLRLVRRAMRHDHDDASVVKAVRRQIHQVTGAFIIGTPDVAALTAAWPRVAPGDRPAWCEQRLREHASTRERLPWLGEFYRQIAARAGTVTRVLDLACGLNPLARHAMPFGAADYLACDVAGHLIPLVDAVLRDTGGGTAFVADLVPGAPPHRADLALVLKLLPLLEHLERGAARRFLTSIQAPTIVVSYPTRTIGGRAIGMCSTYGQQFAALIADLPWQSESLLIGDELVFIVTRPS
ncbi:MAG: 16S rRNA methyltransferase [Chloroflexi bacterium]|nr:16S rRNA methyltransferase [Chloroflexota bacterium]